MMLILAISLKYSVARWPAPPLPPEPWTSAPGCALASAISSLIDFAGSDRRERNHQAHASRRIVLRSRLVCTRREREQDRATASLHVPPHCDDFKRSFCVTQSLRHSVRVTASPHHFVTSPFAMPRS